MALTRPKYSQIYDTDYKQSVRLATLTDVGNLLAGGGNITNTVDGLTVVANDRILVKNQTDSKQNGIYRVVTVGTGSNGTWIRTLDADASDKVTSGMTTTVSEGSQSGTTWKLSTADPITLGTSNLTFVNPFASGAAAGGNSFVQFNDLSSLGGTAGFTFNKFSNAVSVAGSISTANLVVTGNVSANYFLGDGSLLTNVIGTTIRNSANTFVIAHSNGNVTVKGNLVPSSNLLYNLGSPTQRWNVGYFAANTIDLGGAVISVNPSTGTFTFTGGGVTTNLGGNSTFNPAGNVSVGGDLIVSGALYIAGNSTTISSNNLSLNDSLIYMATGNPTDFLDIGIVGNFVRSAVDQHTGLVRDATDQVWKLFEGVEPEPTTTIDFGSASYSTLLLGNLVTRSNVTVGGNIRLGRALLTSAGSGGLPGDYLISTGTGIGWQTPVAPDEITDGVGASVTAANPYILLTAESQVVANIGLNTFSYVGDFNLGSLATNHTLYGNVVISSVGAGVTILNVNDFTASASSTRALAVSSGGQNLWLSANTSGGAWNPTVQNNDALIGLQGMFGSGTGNLTIAGWSNTSSGLRFRTDINQITAPGQLIVSNTTLSTSTTSGAVQIAGGTGISGNLNIGTVGAVSGAFHTVRGNITQTTSGGAVYFNTTGNILAAAGVLNSLTVNGTATATTPSSTSDDTSVATTAFVRDFGGFQGIAVYTNATFSFANTSATVPAGITKIKVTTVGGGGAGGGNPATVGVAGAGGGAGGVCTSYFTVVPGSQYWANVGAGGVGVVNAAGGTGNISTFTLSGTLYHQASGGQGGNLGVATTNVVGGFGGTATGGNLNLTGSAGGVANYHSATAGQSSSGCGGPGYQGYGAGTGVRTAGAGNAPGAAGADGTGAGGSGSVGGAATATTGIGGRGGGGLIIVEY